jgi:hypothetical protein
MFPRRNKKLREPIRENTRNKSLKREKPIAGSRLKNTRYFDRWKLNLKCKKTAKSSIFFLVT